MSATSELPPDIEALARPLERLRSPGVFFCLVPSRGAGEDAEKQIRNLLREKGHRVLKLAADASDHAVTVQTVLHAHPRPRERSLDELNRARDRLVHRQRSLVVICLEVDTPRIATNAADLWSVRAAVIHHGALAAPPNHEAPPLEGRIALPPSLDAETRFLALHGLQDRPGGAPLPQAELDQLYLEQEVALESAPTTTRPAGGEALATLVEHPCALLLGEAGSGKTTILRYLARRLAGSNLSVALVPLAPASPDELTLEDLDASLQKLCSLCPWSPDPGSHPWLLLDGLDEVADPDARNRLALLADDLVRAGKVRGATLSSRPAPSISSRSLERPDLLGGTTGTPHRAASHLPRAKILPLRENRIRTYVDRWVQTTLPASRREVHRRSVLGLLGLGDTAPRDSALLQLCRRPLFLAAVTTLAHSRGAESLDGRYDILIAFVDAMIERRRRGHASRLSAADLHALAGEVAWILHCNETISLPTTPLLAESDILGEEELEALRLSTGLLVDEADRVRFVHASLQDVLVAEEAIDRIDLSSHEDLARFLWQRAGGSADVSSTAPELLAERLGRIRGRSFARFLASELEPSPQPQKAPRNPLDAIRPALRVALLIRNTWGQHPPLHLRRIAHMLRAVLVRIVRDAEMVHRLYPWSIFAAWLAGELGDRSLGDTAFIPIRDGWELARWPVTQRVYERFIRNGGYDDRRYWTREGWRWRQRPARSHPKDRPQRWRSGSFTGENQPVYGISHHEASAFTAWYAQHEDPRVVLPPAWLWKAAACTSAGWEEALDNWKLADGPAPVGAAIHHASRQGVEDLGGLVRQWLAPEAACTAAAGHAWCDDPIPLRDSVRRVTGSGRRWYHPYGLRLARRPPQ